MSTQLTPSNLQTSDRTRQDYWKHESKSLLQCPCNITVAIYSPLLSKR
ncbi:hypothetical protein [Amazonocrinis nigriterrae]|nr:hypothetical protein [Amazonocrinis nigriterrae]